MPEKRCDILFVAPRFHTNQAGLVRALSIGGCVCHFIAERIGPTEDHRYLVPQVLRTKNILGVSLPPIYGLAVALSSLSPRLVVIRNPHHLYGLIVLLLAWVMRRNIFLYTQHPYFSTHGGLMRGVKRLLAFPAGATWITPCLGDRQIGAPIPKSKYVPFCIGDLGDVSALRPYSAGKRLIAVGKMADRKRHIELVRALAELPRQDWHLTIVGESSTQSHEDYLSRLRVAVRESGCEDKIEIRVNVSTMKMPEYYADHDVMVLASRDEPASVSILEAMAAGLFVVSGKGNGTSCYVIHGVTGMTFSEAPAWSMRDVLSAVVDIPWHQIRRGGALGRKYAELFHGVTATNRRFYEYMKVGEGGRRAKASEIRGRT